MKKQIIIALSIASLVVGAVLLNDGTAIVPAACLLISGMCGCFYSVIKFRK